jgi:hypothetical protein
VAAAVAGTGTALSQQDFLQDDALLSINIDGIVACDGEDPTHKKRQRSHEHDVIE